MKEKKELSGSAGSKRGPSLSGWKILPVIAVLLLPLYVLGQDHRQFDEVSVYVRVQNLGMTELEAAISNNEIWLPVSGLFDFLKIRNIASDDLETIEGSFIDPGATYSIDHLKGTITFGDRTWQPVGDGLIMSGTGLCLRSDLYGEVFGLMCDFSFRDLTVTVESGLELPGIRELRLEEMRDNIRRLKGEVVADTTIGRSYPGFRFGMADWSVFATQQPGGSSQVRMNLSVGSVIAGGEAMASLNYYTGEPFTEKQQRYLWRHVNNDRSYLRQILAGKIATHATSSIYDPVVGLQFTNTPTTFRRSYGSYTLADHTEPGWTVELYVNNVLIDYVKADAAGFFSFEVPLVYGNTMVKLKFYGPWGEERTREQNITVPYNFLPKGELEYLLTAGVVEDSLFSRFARASVSYGATRFLTLGGGAEYLSSVLSAPLMPFVNASARLAPGILVSAEYTHGVKAAGLFTYRLPSNIQLDLNYIWYDRDQEAINFNYLEERKASLSVPFRIRKVNLYSRMSFNQTIVPLSYYSTAEWLVTGSFLGVNTSLATYGIFPEHAGANVYSNLSMAFRLPFGFLILPQIQYSYTGSGIISSKLAVQKQVLKHGFLSASYEHHFNTGLRMAELGMRYDFSFAQAGATVRQTNRETTFVEYARGSLINDRATDYLRADNRTNVGRAGISLVAFFDLNANGARDEGEPRAAGISVRANGGRVEKNNSDTTIHILGLEPYVKYFIEIDESGLEDISWRVDNKSIAVITDANMLKLIEIPVTVKGEVTGNVLFEEDGKTSGLGRMIVSLRTASGETVAHALSEADGYYSYFGLAPGSYYLRIDTGQLKRLNMTSEPDTIPFTIETGLDGDYVEGLDFTLRKIFVPKDSIVVTTEEAPVVRKDTSYLVIHEVTRELVTISKDYYAVQFGAFRNKLYAEIMKKKVEGVLDKDVELFEEDGFWKVRITGFENREELDRYIPVIHGQGITEIWVIMNKAVSSSWITKTGEDSLALVRERPDQVVNEKEEEMAAEKDEEVPAGKPREIAESKPVPVVIAGTTIQLGAFSQADETLAMTDRLLAAAEKLVTIRQEGGVYKVQLTGFADTNEVREFIPLLQKHGFTDIAVLHEAEAGLVPVAPRDLQQPVQPEQVEAPVQAEAPVMPGQPAEIVPEKPAEEEIMIEETPPPEPIFILHAGSYYRLSQAEKAKRKIENRLRLPVEIVQEWESYRVIITGFYTREETYPYYPELAGLGFTDIFVYEKPLIDR